MFIALFRAFKTALLTKSFRWLIITVLVTLGIGTAFYVLVERWRIIDSLYFCVVTLATIGYGDLAPQTYAGKIFTIFYIFIGIGLLSSLIAEIFRAFQRNAKKAAEKQAEKQAALDKEKQARQKEADAEKERQRTERNQQNDAQRHARDAQRQARRAARHHSPEELPEAERDHDTE